MTANEFCNLQQCRNIGCSYHSRDKDLCTKVNPPRKPGTVRRGTECSYQTAHWSIKDCRAKKCEHLKNTSGYEDAQERCHAPIGEHNSTMPGTLTCCIQDLDHMPPEEFLRHVSWGLKVDWEKGSTNLPNPGPKNCPDGCVYKIRKPVENENGGGSKKAALVAICAFTGQSCKSTGCYCHVLGNPDQEHQLEVLKEIVHNAMQPADKHLQCGGEFCPDGVKRCGIGETVCPVIKLPLAEIKVCPLWRIPSKMLPAPSGQPAIEAPEKPTPEPEQNTEKESASESPDERLARGKAIAEEVRENRETMARMEQGKPLSKSKKKEKPDPICEACRERMKGNVPAHACEWCREEQQQKGRRAWVTDIKLGSVLLGDMNVEGQRVPAESVDVIFTDPAYVKDQYEQAYADLSELAQRVLKPGGFLFTYAPQAHLDEIMEMLSCNGTWRKGADLQYFWIITSLNNGPHKKAFKWNVICKHKPILVFQKMPWNSTTREYVVKGARKCFSDVVNGYRQKAYHPWQQSVHDVLGIISRFMVPGEILLDPYAGTGTSLIAGQLLGMEVVGFEIDPNTHAIAVREMQQRPLGLIEEDLTPDAEREPAPELKETSRQAGIEDPAKEARPVELKAACLRCKVRETCTTHAPYVNCKKIEAGKAAEEQAPEQSFEPFNIWQMRNCAGCPAPDPCDKREEYLKAFERDGPAALKDNCTRKEEVVGKDPKQDNFMDAVHKAVPKDSPVPAPSGGPTPGTCGTCGHHKGRKTFHETCPRIGELLFKGGTKSAKVLMEETQRDRCEHWIPKAGPPSTSIYPATEPHYDSCPEACPYKGKRGDRHADAFCKFNGILLLVMKECPCHVLGNSAWEFQIRVLKEAIKRRLDEERPSQDNCQAFACPDGVRRCGIGDDCCPINKVPFGTISDCPQWEIPAQYFTKKTAPKKKSPAKPRPYTIYIKRSDGAHPFIVSCDSRGYGGASNPCDTKEEVIQRGLITLGDFVYHVKKPSPTLAKKPLPVTIETTLFIDKTGLFTPADFFDAEGAPKKPIVEPKKTSRKKKEEPES